MKPSLIKLGRRDLTRDPKVFRDHRRFVLACEDTHAAPQYFRRFEFPRVKIEVVPREAGSSSARHVVEALKKYEFLEGDQHWVLLDTDHYVKEEHLTSFRLALKDAKAAGYFVALSRPSFELWLLLHHVDESKVVHITNAKAAEKELSKTINGYNKAKIPIAKFPLASIADACARAERLDATVKSGEIPAANTTRVYKLLRALVESSQKSDLADELLPLLMR